MLKQRKLGNMKMGPWKLKISGSLNNIFICTLVTSVE